MPDKNLFNKVAYNQQWNKENYSEVKLQVRKGIRSKIQARAAVLGKSTNRYILDCILTEMRRNGLADKLNDLNL